MHCTTVLSSLLFSRSGPLMDTSSGTTGAVASLPGALALGLRVIPGGAQTAHAFAGESKSNIGLLEVFDFGFSENRFVSAGSQTAHAIAGEDEGILQRASR